MFTFHSNNIRHCCFWVLRGIFSSGGKNYLICCTFSGLSFLAFDGNACGKHGCSIERGYSHDMLDSIVALASAVSIMILYPPCAKRQFTADEKRYYWTFIRDPLMKGDSIAHIKQDRHMTSLCGKQPRHLISAGTIELDTR